ncbi:low temperature requirement protein LtrA [Nocardia tenerifensis]|uniref:Low temperature requirement protein LtrA n=1 Tax=Nocardia tenerifensis TaxID=228006 RepID=A0A318JT49_9NOCA|nr:low temperature requirement protein A [Nocardia tenerifensis]PXX56455.1 low temperature requirement protein LtrA [Nocardia tenerifensis]
MINESAVASAEGGQLRASTLELFFDLVFVFTITQLTHVFTHHPGWQALGQVALLFGIIWWMYSGYVWLTNEVAPNSSSRRTWLLVGMFSFFVLALAISDAFHGTGLAFGIGYALVTAVHAALFISGGGSSARRAITRIGPFNALAAAFVLAGGLVHGGAQYVCWGLGFAVQVISPYLVDTGDFVVRASHFCERHGLVVIVAIGESIVAIGVGLAGVKITPQLIITVSLALCLAYVLWWAFFGFDDERGEHALAAVPERERSRPAVLAYGYSLYPLLIGVIVTSAGIQMSIGHGNESVGVAAAAALSGGVALYFLAQFFFRLALGLPRPWMRLLAALAVAATIPIGVVWVSWAQLAALVAVGYAAVIGDDLITLRSGQHSSYV